MTCILLIRHGRTDLTGRVLYGRLPGIHLNEEGRRQSDQLAASLAARYRLAAVISSPLERAVETATPLAAVQQRSLDFDPGLTEIDFGDWAGKPFHDLNDLSEWHDFNRSRCTTVPPRGESMIDVQARAWRSMQKAAAQHPPGSYLAFVTHGDVVRGLLTMLLGMSLDHIHRLEIAPASVSLIEIGDQFPVVRYTNQIFYGSLEPA